VILDRFSEIATDRCKGWKAELLECNGEADHVHLLIDYPPDMAVSSFVANLKTTSSRLLRKEFPALQRHYRKPVLWTGAYFVVSTGGAPIEVLRSYIQGQGADSPSR
jgi:putative transposase